MAYHVRRQLREAIATAVTGLTTTGTRVFQSRVYRTEATDWPCLLVYVTDEEIEIAEITAPTVYQRTMQIQVIGQAKLAASLDNSLDQIGKEVETALSADITVGGALVNLELTAVSISMSGDAERPTGEVAMSYRAVLMTAANAPDVSLLG
jgi:hypothetical protein